MSFNTTLINKDPSDDYETFAADYSGIQTNLAIITPAADEHIEIHYIFVSTSANTGSITLTEQTSGTLKYKAYLTATSTPSTGILHNDLALGKALLLTCPANTFISVTYHKRK